MASKIYSFLFQLMRRVNLAPFLLVFHPSSALKTTGWLKSFRCSKVIDKNGNSIPWWTYSFLDFISPRLNKNMRVLEFGCGNSTVFLSKVCGEVLAIEDYPMWANQIRLKIEGNSKVIDVESIFNFSSYNHLITGTFDILIIDNLGPRIETARNGLPFLKSDGVVIWDNTDGEDWALIHEMMLGFGFKELSFSGMIPQELNLSKTTVFYRPDNCLNI